jgi:periplasmic protein TonB
MYPSPKRSALVSGILHAVAIALLLLLTRSKTATNLIPHTKVFVPRDLGRYVVHSRSTRGGGGGGGRDDTPASLGVLPKASPRVFVPPMTVIRNDHPILSMAPALLSPVEIRMPVGSEIGLPDGVIGPPSNGRGFNGGIGDGDGGGIGDRHGPGYGDQDAAGIAGGPAHWAGPASAPVLLWKTEPEYTEEARKARLQGLVVLRIEVDPRGQAHNITVRQSLGLGLDDRAVDAVRRWKFKPGYLNGKPVTTVAVVEVSFHLL